LDLDPDGTAGGPEVLAAVRPRCRRRLPQQVLDGLLRDRPGRGAPPHGAAPASLHEVDARRRAARAPRRAPESPLADRSRLADARAAAQREALPAPAGHAARVRAGADPDRSPAHLSAVAGGSCLPPEESEREAFPVPRLDVPRVVRLVHGDAGQDLLPGPDLSPPHGRRQRRARTPERAVAPRLAPTRSPRHTARRGSAARALRAAGSADLRAAEVPRHAPDEGGEARDPADGRGAADLRRRARL